MMGISMCRVVPVHRWVPDGTRVARGLCIGALLVVDGWLSAWRSVVCWWFGTGGALVMWGFCAQGALVARRFVDWRIWVTWAVNSRVVLGVSRGFGAACALKVWGLGTGCALIVWDFETRGSLVAWALYASRTLVDGALGAGGALVTPLRFGAGRQVCGDNGGVSARSRGV